MWHIFLKDCGEEGFLLHCHCNLQNVIWQNCSRWQVAWLIQLVSPQKQSCLQSAVMSLLPTFQTKWLLSLEVWGTWLLRKDWKN